jgi:hypothetical protein
MVDLEIWREVAADADEMSDRLSVSLVGSP